MSDQETQTSTLPSDEEALAAQLEMYRRLLSLLSEASNAFQAEALQLGFAATGEGVEKVLDLLTPEQLTLLENRAQGLANIFERYRESKTAGNKPTGGKGSGAIFHPTPHRG